MGNHCRPRSDDTERGRISIVCLQSVLLNLNKSKNKNSTLNREWASPTDKRGKFHLHK